MANYLKSVGKIELKYIKQKQEISRNIGDANGSLFRL